MTLRESEMTIPELLDQLDHGTVLKVPFKAHTDQYVYRFPSGIMTTVWGDRSIGDGKIGIMDEEHVKDVLEQRDDQAEFELVPFEESPYAEGWSQ